MTVGQVVLYRHPALIGLELPALVVATPESYQALTDGQLVELGIWNYPGFTSDTDDEDLGRVHLVVFTPSNREPSRSGLDGLGALEAPCFVAANVPYSAEFEPGTWTSA